MSCESPDVKYVDEMPFKERKELCRLLDQHKEWEVLGTHMGFKYEEVEEFMCRSERGDSATNCLLKAWEKENHTVLELCYFLKKMQHIKALKAIKSCIPTKYRDVFLNDGSCIITNILIKQQSSDVTCIVPLTPRATMPINHTSAQHQTDMNHTDAGPQSRITENGATDHHPLVTLNNSNEQRFHNTQDQKGTASTLSSSKVPSTLLCPVSSTPQSGVVGGAVGGESEEIGEVTGPTNNPTVERELSRIRIDEGPAGCISNSEGFRRVAEGPPLDNKPGASAIPKSAIPKSLVPKYILPNSARPYSDVPNSIVPNSVTPKSVIPNIVVPKSSNSPSSSVSPDISQPVSNSSLNGPISQPVAKSSLPSSISTSLSLSTSNASSSDLISPIPSQPNAKSSSPNSTSFGLSQPNAKSSSPSSTPLSLSQPNAKSSSPSSTPLSLSQSDCKPSSFAPPPTSLSKPGYFIPQPPTAANKSFNLPSLSSDEDEDEQK